MESIGIESSTSNERSNLGIHLSQQSQPSRSVIHLLNYDYSGSEDSFPSKSDIRLNIQDPGHDVQFARYYSPQKILDLEVSQREGSFSLIVPELVEWGFVVLAPSESALKPSVSAESAEEKAAKAREALQHIRDSETEWSSDAQIAEANFTATQTALDFDAYDQAFAAAERAIEAADAAHELPTIGIDQAHWPAEVSRAR